MTLLILVVLAGTAVRVVRSRQARRWIRAMVRSGLVLADLAPADYGTLQMQVFLGARRQRSVAINGTTRVPSEFRVTFSVLDRPTVEPVEAPFFAEVAEVLSTEVDANGWTMSGAPRFRAEYHDDVRAGFPAVVAERVQARLLDRASAVDRSSVRVRRPSPEATVSYADAARACQLPPRVDR